MPLKVWNGSAWKLIAQIKVWNGSSWASLNSINNAKTAKVWNGSSWVQFHPGVRLDEYSVAGTVDLFASDTDVGYAFADVEILLNSTGTAEYRYSTSNTPTTNFLSFSWLLTGANSEYYAYMDAPSGDAFTTGTTGTALQLNTTRQWKLLAEALNPLDVTSLSNTSTLRIRNIDGTDIVSISTAFSVIASAT